MTVYEVRIIGGGGDAEKQFDTPGELGAALAELGRAAGILEIETRAVEDDEPRPLTAVEEAAVWAGIEQAPGLECVTIDEEAI